jgi:hypothetical protein
MLKRRFKKLFTIATTNNMTVHALIQLNIYFIKK